jgi:hypothetical protein
MVLFIILNKPASYYTTIPTPPTLLRAARSPVVGEEGRVSASLLLGQHVDLGLELGVRGDGAWLGNDLAALDVVSLEAAQKNAHVVSGLAVIHALLEHLHT